MEHAGALLVAGVLSLAGAAAAGATEVRSKYDLANGCFAVASRAADAFIAPDGAGGYRASAPAAADAAAFHMKPTGLGTYLFHDREGRLLNVEDPAGRTARSAGSALSESSALAIGLADILTVVDALSPVERATDDAGAAVEGVADRIRAVNGPGVPGRGEDPDELAEWALDLHDDGFSITSTAQRRRLAASPKTGELTLAEPGAAGDRFDFVLREGCTAFPEAELGASGEPFKGTNPDGTVFGIADAHTHISAYQRLGGRVIHGAPFHRFGVTRALDDGGRNHGPSGTTDLIGNFLREGAPVGTHQTEGWPRFPDWPAYDTFTHQQSYYVWVQRAWMAGLRLLVNHVSGDEQLCQIYPIKRRDCDEMEGARIQIRNMRALQDYVDAQAGGPGDGFLRIVESPAEARRVIEDGKLAVVLGIESSKLFGCGEFLDEPECTKSDIDAAVDEFHALGVRTVFPAHWFDNAYAGAGLFDQSEVVLNAFNKLETGHYYEVERCPEEGMGAELQSFGHHLEGDDPLSQALNRAQATAVPTYPEGPHCNARGLTELGEHLIERLIAKGMLIETDHLGAKAKNQVLDIAEAHDQPVISGHFHSGGVTSSAQLRRIFALGGLAAPSNHQPSELPDRVRLLEGLKSDEHFFGVPLSTDTGGLAAQPAPLGEDETALEYPFTSYDGRVTFVRQRTGERVFDLNEDGVAHYGLYADWLAAAADQPGGREALERMFRSAEAYLQMWERAAAATG